MYNSAGSPEYLWNRMLIQDTNEHNKKHRPQKFPVEKTTNRGGKLC